MIARRPKSPKTVFVSYRRDDTAASAGRVYDRLCRILEPANVFFDVSAIRGGEDFVARIRTEIGRSDVVLVFIGEKWLDGNKPRLWETHDHVRAEVRAALEGSRRVLPVLVGHARMPDPERLPEDIRPITTRNALLLRHESFDDDTETIVAAVLGVPARRSRWADTGTLGGKLAYAVGGAVVLCGLVLAVALVHFWVFARPLSASIGAPLTTALLVIGAVAGAWLGLRVEARKRTLR